ncbi:MAG: UvrD-helicase domain-containing protein [Bacteroidales bacterium]|jgi:DNA helicase-2/ATP-dependent DNA helicase PcrA|nr:UvrD-helicase domain-containing protein [Bacteroidales bacterium]
MTDFLKDLNDVQREAVVNYDGPSLIIAGAGSGKTRVLTYRIAYLLTQGIAPGSILSLTFTNKAAREMKARIAQLVSESEARRLWMGTFHSVFARILRSEAEATGYPSNFSIYDTQDSKNVVKQIIKEMKLDEQVYKIGDVYNRISSAKNNLVTANMYASNPAMNMEDAAVKRPRIHEIYRQYAQRCFKAGAMDFDDILLNTNILFRDHPEILDKYQRFFRYILVDEYQDTNSAQYMIVKKLAAQRTNICVVGDDAQSIYAFRGARIENILNFRKDYPNYKMFKLEQNYRSTQNIVNAANTLIEKNRNRIQKVVFSKNDEGDRIRVFHAGTDQEEGYVVAASILEMKYCHRFANRDFAILYRTNAQSRIFEEALRKRNIPYRIYGGLSFYERREIKDVLAYGRLLVNPKDDEAFRRVINFPARGIGDTTVGRLEMAAHAAGLSLWDVAVRAEQLAPDIASAARGKLHKFIGFMDEYAKKQARLDAYELLHRLIIATGIIASLQAEKTPENISRLQNIDELLNGIHEFVDENNVDHGLVTLDQYLANVSLLTNADNDKAEDADKVAVMTVHSSKGLEFDVVYIVGMEESLFPSQMSVLSMQDIEEERRLFYVALTRARKYVFLSYAGMRFRWGSMAVSSPSRFIREIDPRFLEFAGETARMINHPLTPKQTAFNSGQSARLPNLNPLNTALNPPAAASVPPADGMLADDPEKIRTGMTVEHSRLGHGKVLAIDGSGANAKVTVHFGGGGQKQLLLKFAKLRIVG